MVPYNDAFVPANPYVSYANFCARGLAGNNECFGTDTQSKVWGSNLTMDWKLADDLALKSITAFRELDSTWTNDDDASPIGSSLGESNMRNHTLTQELRLTGNVGKVLDYSVGGFFLDQVTTYESHQILDYVIPATPFEFIQDDPVHEKVYAGFANGTWHITDGLDFNAGVRYTHQDKEYTYVRLESAEHRRWRQRLLRSGLLGHDGDVRRLQGRLPREPRLPLERRAHDLCQRLHRLQGRWRQPAAVRALAGREVRSRGSDFLRTRCQDRFPGSQPAGQHLGVLREVQGHPGHAAELPGVLGWQCGRAVRRADQRRRCQHLRRRTGGLVPPGRLLGGCAP